MKYTVLIGDLKRSRKVEDRAAFEDKLQSVLKNVNARRAENVEMVPKPWRKIQSTQGLDLIVGVYDHPSRAIAAAVSAGEQLQREIFPEKFRFGIGFGDIDIGANKPLAKMDGEAFHFASDALEEAEQKEIPFKLKLDTALIKKEAQGLLHHQVQLVEQTMRCLDVIRSDWTTRLPNIYKVLQGRSQKEAAKELGIAQQAVSKAAKQGNFEEYQDTLLSVVLLLNSIQGEVLAE